MPKIDHDTKEKILAAAEKVFHSNGFKGTRTSQIAEEAGISRTMLHYYFNSKEALFQEVLKNTIGTVLSHTKKVLDKSLSLDQLIEHVVEVIADVFEAKPGLPSFVVNLLNESPEIAYFLAYSQNDTLPVLLNEVLKEAQSKGEVDAHLTGEDLVINIYGLCAIPYLGASYIKIKEKRDDEAMRLFLKARKEKIKRFVLKGIQP